MDRRLTQSMNPLNYRGVNALTPPDLIIHKRAPTIRDYLNFEIGTIWLNNSGIYLTPPVSPSNSDIWMLVSVSRHIGVWVFFGAPVPPPNTLTGNTGLAVGPDINNNIDLLSGIVAFNFNGVPANNVITLESVTGYPLFQSMSDDTGTKVAPNLLGDIAILGTAGRVTTTGSLANNNLVFNASQSIGSDFTANDGNAAAPVLGIVKLLGNNNIITSVTAVDTIQIDLSGTTNHALQLGNAFGSLTSLGVATNGQLPIGSTGANPVLNTLTAGSGISVTNGPGSINIEKVSSNTPAFFAYISGASINNVTGDATIYDIIFDGKSIDSTNSFSIITGKYTVQTSGYYYLGFNCSYRAKANGAQQWATGIRRNGVTIIGATGGRPTIRFVPGFYGYNNAIEMYIEGFSVLCNAGDILSSYVQGDTRGAPSGKVDDIIGSNGINGVGTYFFGFLRNA